MNDIPGVEPANLRFLRRLVTTLTATMIVGLVVLIGLIVIRLQTPQPILPASIMLPDGTTPLAFTHGRGWYAVVTENDEILIYDQKTGELRQTITIAP